MSQIVSIKSMNFNALDFLGSFMFFSVRTSTDKIHDEGSDVTSATCRRLGGENLPSSCMSLQPAGKDTVVRELA